MGMLYAYIVHFRQGDRVLLYPGPRWESAGWHMTASQGTWRDGLPHDISTATVEAGGFYSNLLLWPW